MKFSYTGIRVKELGQSIEFYTKVFGMQLGRRFKIPVADGEIAELKSPGSEHYLELNYYYPSSRFNTPYSQGEELDHLAFQVDDLDKTIQELRARGVELALGPLVQSGVRWAYVKDPNGIWIELIT